MEIIEGFIDKRNLIVTKEKGEMTKNCFWIPEKTPFYKGSDKHKPSDKLNCPSMIKDHFVRLKELIDLKLKKNDKGHKYICHVCNKDISFQKVDLIKSCGHIMCKVRNLLNYL